MTVKPLICDYCTGNIERGDKYIVLCGDKICEGCYDRITKDELVEMNGGHVCHHEEDA